MNSINTVEKVGKFPRLLIAGDHGGAGKTTVTLGLCASLAARGTRVQPFKKGPDFIDPMWLSQAAGGRQCRNLDRFLMGGEIPSIFAGAAGTADISVIEGNKGLFDSMDTEGRGSSASLARLLGAPVILVIDCTKKTRGVAALLKGYTEFEPDLFIAGVILNNVATARHEEKLKAAIQRYTDLEVLGTVFRSPELEISERHLGLIPAEELEESRVIIERIGKNIGERLDLERIIQIARAAPDFSWSIPEISSATKSPSAPEKPVARIGVARDRAFGFYYPENLEAMEAQGAELVFFSPLADSRPPEADALYFGGGFPEAFLEELNANRSFRETLKELASRDLPIYAECGGLMYLSRSINWRGAVREMAGILPCDIIMNDRPQGRGYMKLRTVPRDVDREYSERDFWRIPADQAFRAHEFHYSRIKNLETSAVVANFRVDRGYGIDGTFDGIKYRNVLAAYAHLNVFAAPWWAPEFVDAARRCARGREAKGEVNRYLSRTL